MEIAFSNVKCQSQKLCLEQLTMKFTSSKIVGVYGEDSLLLLKVLGTNLPYEGTIQVFDIYHRSYNLEQIFTLIGYVGKDSSKMFNYQTVKKEITSLINYYRLLGRDIQKKLVNLLHYFNLDRTLNKSISELSMSERKLLTIVMTLSYEPRILLLEEPFMGLDMKYKKKLLKLLKLLRDKWQMLIIVNSKDVDLLYEVVDDIIVTYQHKLLKVGKPVEVFKELVRESKVNIELPKLVSFTFKVQQEKKVRLMYRRDIKDLIKDIYRHIT